MKASEGSERNIYILYMCMVLSVFSSLFNACFLFFLFNDGKIKALSTMKFSNYHTLLLYIRIYIHRIGMSEDGIDNSLLFLFTLKSHLIR